VKVFNSAPAGAVIGGKTYPTVVMPDGHEWLALNLDLIWDDLSVPTSGASVTKSLQAMYYNYDEATYGWNGLKRGLLYNHYAVGILQGNRETLCPGWHVPTKAEYDALVTAIGGSSNGAKLKSTTGWRSLNGTDDYGFAGYPSGSFAGSFGYIDYKLALWTLTNSGTASAYSYILTSDDNNISSLLEDRRIQYSVRLIKDY
jgi:uncharacterized protein (TIGR02145 family)